VFDAASETYMHFDSCSNHNLSAARATAALFNQLLHAPTATVKAMSCPQQPNSCDCGIYALLVAEFLAAKYREHGSIVDVTEDGAELHQWLTPAKVADAREEMFRLATQKSEAYLAGV
jgi:Ulp1 family protease